VAGCVADLHLNVVPRMIERARHRKLGRILPIASYTPPLEILWTQDLIMRWIPSNQTAQWDGSTATPTIITATVEWTSNGATAGTSTHQARADVHILIVKVRDQDAHLHSRMESWLSWHFFGGQLLLLNCWSPHLWRTKESSFVPTWSGHIMEAATPSCSSKCVQSSKDAP